MPKIEVYTRIDKSIDVLRSLQWPNGLFSNAKGQNSLLRDCIYQSIGLEAVGKIGELTRAYHAIFNVFLRHEYKLDFAIKNVPKNNYQYISQKYEPRSMNEVSEFGNKQNDIIGLFLFKVGDLENKGIRIIRNNKDRRILSKLVAYLKSIKYWEDNDNGMWQTKEEKHASSIGACVAGLSEIKNLVNVPEWMIMKGFHSLNRILPRESKSRETDLALLSLIYPFDVVYGDQRKKILENVEDFLLRERGVARFRGDEYCTINGMEAEFTMGMPWLAIIYKKINKPNKYAYYMRKTMDLMNEKGEFPEVYFGNTKLHNEKIPFGWTHGLYLKMCSTA